ncbi:helix-turn-helix domain-containing protein [Micromonospora tarensis]|uniref:Helix-turn-helix domain-containing protein n=1 Tax=Micromonospora tarensis TaxID=2806100 RepID=A0ABS1YHV2_9ACTN|nr:helix-turn-helix domain-containing protein [Micromonospora tarensis]
MRGIERSHDRQVRVRVEAARAHGCARDVLHLRSHRYAGRPRHRVIALAGLPLVAGTPERVTISPLLALCDIFDCQFG